jgi:hypothetical protein
MIEDKEREEDRKGERVRKNISCEVVIFRLHGATM